jgi:hypothetical protein
MKKTWAGIGIFLLISLMLCKDIYSFTYQIYFFKNQQAIADKFCENKARPQLKCNGKCHLAKQLKKIEQEEMNALKKKQLPPLKIKASEVFYCSFFPEISISTGCVPKDPVSYIFPSGGHHQQLRDLSVFHPPQLIG